MGWKVVTRKLGRAGGAKERAARQRQWDQKYGEGMWEIGYVLDGQFITQEEALDVVYYESYRSHFASHPEDLEELLSLAKALQNPHAKATTGVDLQVPAIIRYLQEHNLALRGSEWVDIGSWQGKRSHAISERLSPLHIRCSLFPKMTLEKFWQSKKCLAVWKDD